MTQLYALEVWLPEEEIDTLDLACEIFGLCTGDSHSQFIRRCLLYGLLSLRDAGVLEALQANERVDLRGFGSFVVKDRKERQGRNPRTGQPITIAAKRDASFRPGKELIEKLAQTDETAPRAGEAA